MKLLINFVVVIAIFFSTSIAAATNGTTNVVPIIKQHHALLKASNANSIATTVFSSEIAKTDAVATARVTSVRDGADFQDFFEMSVTCDYVDEWGTSYEMTQSFPDAPYQDYGSVSIYSAQNANFSYMRWWGDPIWHRYNGNINAEYPLAKASFQAEVDSTYSLITEINLAYDWQDEFRIQYRYLVQESGFETPNPPDGGGDGIDQEGWPVWIETWDLRPNLHPYQITVYNDDGPIGADNPPIADSTLYAIAMTEENAGFWAGITDVQFYQDSSDVSFYETNTAELDSGEVSADTSTGFVFNRTGIHSIKVIVNQGNLINETDSTDNEMIFYFNVMSMSDTPAVAINPIQSSDWNDVLFTWFGNNLAGDTLEYHYKLDSEAWSVWDTLTSVSYSDLTSGEHNFYVEVRSPNGLMDADSTMLVIDQPVELADITNVILTYGETLELDLVVTGGSGTYTYDAVYGTIDASGHYSWTPTYSSNPYSEVITANCVTWPNNYDTESFLIEVNLSDVIITGLDTNYVVLEEDVLSDSEISASGGDNSSYNWTLTANTTGGDWLALTSSNGAVTGFTGTAPSVGNATVYDYTLSCASQTQSVDLSFTVTAWPVVSFTVESNYNFLQNHDAQIQLNASGGDSSNYTWTVSDSNLLTIDSTLGNSVWLAANTNDMGTFQVDVSCSQLGFPANGHTEQLNYTVGQSLWTIEPMEINFPTTQATQTMVISNTSVNGLALTYALTLSNWTSYDIASPLSGSLSAGESDTVQVVNHENNTPYELAAQIDININDGAYLPVVNLTTAASNTSLQAFSFSRGTDPAQPLTIWNTTLTEQSVELTEIGGIFSVSTDQVTIAAGNFSIVYINTQGSMETVYDTLVLTSADINAQVSLRKQPAINNTVLYSYDDGMADNQIQYGGYLVNSFNIESGYQLMGMELFLPVNNQLFNWVILDDNLNQLYSEEYQSNYSGWQQFMLAPDNYYDAGTYYLGVTSVPNEPELIVGMDNTSTGVSWSDSSGSFEQLNAMLFIRAISSTTVGIDDNENVPLHFSLDQNYPNPFNPTTTITYSLPTETDVQLTIYSLTGQVVARLVNERQDLGNYAIRVDMGSYGLSSGIYFYQLTTPEFQAVKKLMLIK